jgi:hypothetical protein
MMRGARSFLSRIQGDEAGKSPKRALTVELTQESTQRTIAHRVAQILAIGGVVLPHETAAGIAAVARLAESRKFAATPHIRILQGSHYEMDT